MERWDGHCRLSPRDALAQSLVIVAKRTWQPILSTRLIERGVSPTIKGQSLPIFPAVLPSRRLAEKRERCPRTRIQLNDLSPIFPWRLRLRTPCRATVGAWACWPETPSAPPRTFACQWSRSRSSTAEDSFLNISLKTAPKQKSPSFGKSTIFSRKKLRV